MRNLFLFASFMTITLSMFGQRGSIGNKQMQVGALEMQEYNILYQGYNNIIIGVGSGVDSYTLNGQSPTMVGGRPQFIVNPSSLGPMTLTLMGKTKDGQVKLASNTYNVNKMPKPALSSVNYSKSSGVTLLLGETDPIKVPYTVVGSILIDGEDPTFTGNRIPRDQTKKKVGKKVGVKVKIRNGLTGKEEYINGDLTIIP